MTLEVLLTKSSFVLGSLWRLRKNIDGFKSENSDELATQASVGRRFQLIACLKSNFQNKEIIERVKVRLLEDDYICWFRFKELIYQASKIESWEPDFFTEEKIISRIPRVLSWTKDAKKMRNKYLWGGTLGPNFDCSGLVQSAFASSGIWIPRDASQQEKFCKNIGLDVDVLAGELKPGDLLFFGSSEKCTHVALHIENGFYIHSSGVTDGHNGIEIDGLFQPNPGKISSFYRSKFRSAGRVISCYQSENSKEV